MTQEIYQMDVDELPDVGDDQKVHETATAFPTGWDDNLPVLPIGGEQLAEPSDPPAVAPSVTLISPTSGRVGNNTPIVVDVTDSDSDFTRILLVATLEPGPHVGVSYLVHDGDAFRPGFENYSSRLSITDGYRYSIRKNSGWESTVRIEVFSFDDQGNEGEEA